MHPVTGHTVNMLFEHGFDPCAGEVMGCPVVDRYFRHLELEAKDKRSFWFRANAVYALYVAVTLGLFAEPIMGWLL